MLNTRRILIVVGIFLCAFVSTGCEPVEPASGKIGQIWLVDETYSPADAAVRARMNQTLPKLELPDVAFRDVVHFLREFSEVNIHVKWAKIMWGVGVTRETKVNIYLTDVTFTKALQVILDNVGGVNRLDYIIDGGVITISTRDDLSRYTITRLYDVRDLIDRPRLKSDLPDKALLVEAIRDAIHRPIKAPKKDKVFKETLAEAYEEHIEELAEDIMDEFPCRDTYIADLMYIIRTSVDMTSWRSGAACGDIASMMELDGKLIITQTHRNHRHIERLLSAMRKNSPVIFCSTLPLEPPKPKIIPPTPEEILTRTPATVPPEKWPAGNKKTIGKSVKIMGVNTSRIYVVFLVDCSGSMLDSLGDAVGKQITPALENLSGEQYFSVICFHGKSTLNPFRGKLVQATDDNKKKAALFLREKAIAAGNTSLLPALAKTYSAMDVANGSDSQVIFLLTDGEFPHSKSILDVVARRSKHIKIPIHTYDYHASNESVELLKRLSEITGGKYKAMSRNKSTSK